MAFVVLLGSVTSLTACHEGSESQLKETVDSFAEAYFNWQFPRAVPYCTQESRRWLSYAASQVNEYDVDSLRAMDRGAEHEISDIHYDNDSMAIVNIAVHHYMSMDSLGQAARLVDEGLYRVPVVYKGERWLVELRGLPRPQRER